MKGMQLIISAMVLLYGIELSAVQDAESALDDIIQSIEARYSVTGFSAQFNQTSVIKAMDIEDKAHGTVLIKRPNKMRWEYLEPEPQSIITNGTTLWVLRPLDKQVMIGKAPEYFGDGKGASFLTDIRMIREKFHIILIDTPHPQFHCLNMIPKQKEYDIAEIRLEVSKQNFDIIKITTVNHYDDETIIEFSHYKFDENPEDVLFEFKVPKNIDILRLEQ